MRIVAVCDIGLEMLLCAPCPAAAPRMKQISCILLLVLFCALSVSSESQTQQKQVALVYLGDQQAAPRTIKGIRKAFSRSEFDVIYHEAILTGNPAADNEVARQIGRHKPDILLTVGSYPTEVIGKHFPETPIIFATVLNPVASGFVKSMNRPRGNITGASLDIPPELQFTYFRQVVDELKRVGVIYTDETANIVAQARQAGRRMGIELVDYHISSEKEVPRAMDSLCRAVDGIWSVADRTVYTPNSTRYIILQTLRNRLPLMGFSQQLVEAGGLFSLDYDFKDIGRQAGDIALQVLRGKNPGAIPVATPGVIYFNYNAKTADQINVKLPEDLLAIAKEVTE